MVMVRVHTSRAHACTLVDGEGRGRIRRPHDSADGPQACRQAGSTQP